MKLIYNYLNTSNVNVNQALRLQNGYLMYDLNTSNVNQNLTNL